MGIRTPIALSSLREAQEPRGSGFSSQEVQLMLRSVRSCGWARLTRAELSLRTEKPVGSLLFKNRWLFFYPGIRHKFAYRYLYIFYIFRKGWEGKLLGEFLCVSGCTTHHTGPWPLHKYPPVLHTYTLNRVPPINTEATPLMGIFALSQHEYSPCLPPVSPSVLSSRQSRPVPTLSLRLSTQPTKASAC